MRSTFRILFYINRNKAKKKLHIIYMLYVLKILLKRNEMR